MDNLVNQLLGQPLEEFTGAGAMGTVDTVPFVVRPKKPRRRAKKALSEILSGDLTFSQRRIVMTDGTIVESAVSVTRAPSSIEESRRAVTRYASLLDRLKSQ